MDRLSRAQQRMALAFCIAFALQCLGYALLLPPLEEFDATGHFAYVSVLADRGEIPDFRHTLLDGRLEDATRDMPRPYGGQPPFESNGGLTYAQFFSTRTPQEQQDAAGRFWREPLAAQYEPRGAPNWQGQHPPLFYALMVPIYRLTAGQSPGMQLTALRMSSVAIACVGLAFWWLTLCRLPDGSTRLMWLSGGALILALPSCWFDLGRFGNDSLAACCLTATVYFLLRAADQRTWRDVVCLASACGCGLLTKAFFVPITAAVIVCMFVADRRATGLRRAAVRGLVLISLIAAVSGAWFVLFTMRYGSPLGSHETWMAAQRATWAGQSLPARGFVLAVLRGLAACGATFLWSGTWSWVRRPDWHYLLMLPLLLMGVVMILRQWRSWITAGRTPGIQMVSAAVLASLAMGLVAHIVFRVRVHGIGAGTPGYYLFVAWPLVGVFLSPFWNWFGSRRGRWLGAIALVAAVLMEWTGLWFCMQVYAGVIAKTGSTAFGVGGMLPTPANMATVFERLQLLCFPIAAMACLLAALAIKIVLWVRLAVALARPARPRVSTLHAMRARRQAVC